jgi:hypothetical protein
VSGFSHDIAGGNGNLVVTSLKSPNFAHGTSGWTVNKDGSAEFANVTLRGTFAGLDYVINSAGAFFYSATPADGNLVASIAQASGTDAYGNAFLAGIWLYENASSGNAKGGLMWNTFAGSQPLLALFPDASWAFTGNSPYMLAGDASKGLASEYTYLKLGSGNPPSPNQASHATVQLFSGSPDQVTSLPHVSILGTSDVQYADFNHSRFQSNLPVNVTSTAAPATPASGAALWADSSGILRVLDQTGNTLALGRLLVQNAAGTSLPNGGGYANVTTPVTLPIGTYRISGQLSYNTSLGSPTGTVQVKYTAGTAVLGHARGSFRGTPSTASVIDGALTGTYTGATLTAAEQLEEWDFIMPVTTGGTFVVQAQTTGTSCTANFANLMIEPV